MLMKTQDVVCCNSVIELPEFGGNQARQPKVMATTSLEHLGAFWWM